MNASEEAIIEEALVHLPGAAAELCARSLRQAAIEFCERSGAWGERLSVIAAGGEAFVSPTWGLVTRVRRIVAEGGREVLGWEFLPPSTVTVPPGVEGALTAFVVCRPENTTDDLDEDFIARFRTPLVNGLLYRMFVTPAKPWSNAALAAYYEAKFHADIVRAADLATKSGNPQAATWRFPPFA